MVTAAAGFALCYFIHSVRQLCESARALCKVLKNRALALTVFVTVEMQDEGKI
jgi:hypothetical protein